MKNDSTVELLDIIRIMACDGKKRCRLRKDKLKEIDKEFLKILKTRQRGNPLPKSGYMYLKVTESVSEELGSYFTIQALRGTHGSKVIIHPGNWKTFVEWVNYSRSNFGFYNHPNTLEQWRKKYEKVSLSTPQNTPKNIRSYC